MKNTVLMVLTWMIVLSGCALQQDVISLDDRLAQSERRYAEAEQKNKNLESKLSEYGKSLDKDDKDLRSKTASQSAMIDSLREEIRILSGRLEEAEYFLKQKIQAFEKSSEVIDKTTNSNKDRIARLEQYLNFESTASGQKSIADSGKTSEKQVENQLSEDGIYQSAKQAYDQGDFEAAREGFNKLITQYPTSKNADNAQFWIGEIYYHEKWYEKAILEYQKVIEIYPKGNKVQASLLKQGFAFLNLGDKSNARLILSELIKKYPKSNEAKIAQRKLKGLAP
ncbi:MAG TPA: tol-pal system protein YbgF [Desulfobacterales bacterium]|nr:tol-pal system protein YbgF [Desulfobacterales bacterium]